MKILYHHRIASKDGQYVHIAEIVNSLKSLGHEVIIVEPGSINQKQFGESANLVSYLRSLLPNFFHELIEFLYSLVDFLRISRAIKKFRPDCIYERYNLFFPSGIWAKKFFDLPLILEVNSPLCEERSKHGHISLRRLAEWSERYVWNFADYVLPVTQVLADRIISKGVSIDKIRVIPNGINREQFSDIAHSNEAKRQLGFENRLIMGFTGFVRDWHGLDRVLNVIARNPDRKCLLLVVGDGPVRKTLETQARELGIEEKIQFTGIISRDKVPEYVACFDIALQPDVVPYASPLKLFEYLGLGKAVLAPDRKNIREILTDHENALLFNPESDFDFEEKLSQLCESQSLRLRLGNGAQQLVRDRGFYWDNNAGKITALFDELLKSNQRTRNIIEN